MNRCLLLIVALLLTSCQKQQMTTSTRTNYPDTTKYTKHIVQKGKWPNKNVQSTDKDGPPPGPTPSRYTKVVPVKESISRYGNPGAYKVNGHTYEVLTTAKGYKERGLASWYGTKFHSKRTSSGKNYNLYDMTAAHRTLPLPTYVKVTNLKNGRNVIVKVIDRGPFHHGRIIDLSYGAAAKLGFLPTGTTSVEVEALSTHDHVARYYIQAGAFSTVKLAEDLRRKIKRITTSPVAIEKYQHYFVVKMGPFANKRMSDTTRAILSSKGITGAFSMLQ
jgi:rare lipoprotein A